MEPQITEIYKILSYNHQLTDDDSQDIAVKCWENIDSFDATKGALSTWVNKVAKNHMIDCSRKEKADSTLSTIPISHFDIDGDIISNPVVDFLLSHELSPVDCMIAQEERQVLAYRIKSLSDKEQEVMQLYMQGEIKTNADRITLSRSIQKIKEKARKKYTLLDLITGEEYYVNYLTEAAEITGHSREGIAYALKKSGKFDKKRWKISEF